MHRYVDAEGRVSIMNGDLPHNKAYLRGLTTVELVDLLESESSIGNEMDNRKRVMSVREELLRRLDSDSIGSRCVACNGSGRYDSAGSPPCGACAGSGYSDG